MPGPDHGNADRAASTSPPGGRPPPAQSWSAPERVGWRFVTLYALSYTGGSLLFLAPLLVSLALKVNDLVGIEAAPRNLAWSPASGRCSPSWPTRCSGGSATAPRPGRDAAALDGDRGGRRRGRDPDCRHRYEHAVVLVGWCVCQVFFNATLAAQAAVLPDQVPSEQRGLVSGLLGLSVPVASVVGTYLVQAFSGSMLLMFLAPCAVGGARRPALRVAAARPSPRPAGQASVVACGNWPEPSTSTLDATLTSRGPSSAGSSSSSPTRSS